MKNVVLLDPSGDGDSLGATMNSSLTCVAAEHQELLVQLRPVGIATSREPTSSAQWEPRVVLKNCSTKADRRLAGTECSWSHCPNYAEDDFQCALEEVPYARVWRVFSKLKHESHDQTEAADTRGRSLASNNCDLLKLGQAVQKEVRVPSYHARGCC